MRMDKFPVIGGATGVVLLLLSLFGCAHPPGQNRGTSSAGDRAAYSLRKGPEGTAAGGGFVRSSRAFRPIDSLVIEPHGFQYGTFLAPANQEADAQYTIILRNLSGKDCAASMLPLRFSGATQRIARFHPGTSRRVPIRRFAKAPENGALSFYSLYSRLKNRRYSLGGFDYDRSLGLGGPQFEAIESDFPMVCNDTVKEFICYFQDKENFMETSLARAEQYLPMMKSIFRENDLPEDLAYLSLVESGFNPHAFSHAGASGPWQFMKGTARRYGLQMNQYVDERKDPEKSTRAAVKYLKDLYSMFGDWYLAVTAYNAGEGNVAQAIKKHNTTDFWELQKITYLKAESREFVPKLLAAITIGKQPEEFGFDDFEMRVPHLTKVRIPYSATLKSIADAAEVSLAQLKAYNPELRNYCTPPNNNGYWIKIPVGKKEVFERNFSKKARKAVASAGGYREHRIKRGETLSHIARQYRTDVRLIQELNGIRDPRTLSPGRVIRIPPSSRRPS